MRACASSNTGLSVSGSESLLPLACRLTISTPAETNTSPSPALIACMAIRVVCSDDAQYRVTVVPGRWSKPSRTATTRPMLNPASPPGRPQPSIRSSMSVGSSCGTLSSAARTMLAARSSGRTSRSEPLNARPIGERAVATMTASAITSFLSGEAADAGDGTSRETVSTRHSVPRTAGDVDDLAGHEPGFVAHEERDRGRDVVGLAGAGDRDLAAAAALNSSNVTPARAAVATVMSVSMKPGATALAVTPNLPSSIASVLVKPCRPAFAAE